MQIIVRHSGADISIENLSLSEAVIIRKKSATDEFRAKVHRSRRRKPFFDRRNNRNILGRNPEI